MSTTRIKANIYFYPRYYTGLGHVEVDIYETTNPLDRPPDSYIKIELPEIEVDRKLFTEYIKFTDDEIQTEREEAKNSFFGIPERYSITSNNCCHRAERRLFMIGFLESRPQTKLTKDKDSKNSEAKTTTTFSTVYQALTAELEETGRHQFAITPQEFTRQMTVIGLKRVADLREKILADKDAMQQDPVTQIKRRLNNDIQRLKLDRYNFTQYGLFYYDGGQQETFDIEIRKLDELLQIDDITLFVTTLQKYSEKPEFTQRDSTTKLLKEYNELLSPANVAISQAAELLEKRDVILRNNRLRLDIPERATSHQVASVNNPPLKESQDKALKDCIHKHVKIAAPRIYVPDIKNNAEIQLHFISHQYRFTMLTFLNYLHLNNKVFQIIDTSIRPRYGHHFFPAILVLKMPKIFANEITPEFYLKTLIETQSCKKQLENELKRKDISAEERLIKENKIQGLNQIFIALTNINTDVPFHAIISQAKHDSALVLKRVYKSRTEGLLDSILKQSENLLMHGKFTSSGKTEVSSSDKKDDTSLSMRKLDASRPPSLVVRL